MPRTGRKDDIRRAALELFATRGVLATSLKDIAGAAGVSDAAIYRHYQNKDDLAWTIFCEETKRVSDAMASELSEPGTPWERLLAAVRRLYKLFLEDQAAVRFVLLAQHEFPQRTLLTPQDNPNNLVHRFIAQALPNVPTELGTAVAMGAVLQPLVMHVYNRLTLSPDTADQVCLATMAALSALATSDTAGALKADRP